MNSTTRPMDILVGKVRGLKRSGKGLAFCCPAHDDRNPSAWVVEQQDGRLSFRCQAGCSPEEIAAALGLDESALYRRGAHRLDDWNLDRRILRLYVYTDESGATLYEHPRMKQRTPRDPKCQYRRQLADGGYVWSLGAGWCEKKGRDWFLIRDKETVHDPQQQPAHKPDARWFDEAPRRVLYDLPTVRALLPGALLFFTEGEKDAETAKRLGFVATTAGGASDWRTPFAAELAGLDVVIFPDNDSAGRLWAARVARDCLGVAGRVRVVTLPGLSEHGDLSDWVEAGGARDELLALVAAAADYEAGEDDLVDITALEELEVGERVSTDQDREDYLRHCARNTAKVLDAVRLLLFYLGFKKNHHRLLSALLRKGRDNLGVYAVKQEWLVEQYVNNGEKVSSAKTVQRDLKALIKEQDDLGVCVLFYRSGQEGIASRFQNHFLRYALEAINEAIDRRDDFDYSWEALEKACQAVAKRVPRDELALDDAVKKRKRADELKRAKQKATAEYVKYLRLLLERGNDLEVINTEAREISSRALRRISREAARQTDEAADSQQAEEVLLFR